MCDAVKVDAADIVVEGRFKFFKLTTFWPTDLDLEMVLATLALPCKLLTPRHLELGNVFATCGRDFRA